MAPVAAVRTAFVVLSAVGLFCSLSLLALSVLGRYRRRAIVFVRRARASDLTAQLFAIVASLAQITSLIAIADLSDSPFQRLLSDVPVGCLISAILSPCVRAVDLADISGPSGPPLSSRRPSSPSMRCSALGRAT